MSTRQEVEQTIFDLKQSFRKENDERVGAEACILIAELLLDIREQLKPQERIEKTYEEKSLQWFQENFGETFEMTIDDKAPEYKVFDSKDQLALFLWMQKAGVRFELA